MGFGNGIFLESRNRNFWDLRIGFLGMRMAFFGDSGMGFFWDSGMGFYGI